MNKNHTVIRKGTAAWQDLFYDNDPESFWGPDFCTDTLYAKGDLSALLDQERPKILFVGTREIGSREKDVIHLLIEQLAANPCNPVIVSGLDVGTDTAVHEYALKYGLSTVAVVGNGLDVVYPYHNRELTEKISRTTGCAILSQFSEGTTPDAFNLLLRCKTMAMISDTAVIPFSKRKGSAMVCARLMDERNRMVYAVPGRLYDDTLSAGCNELIREGIATILCRDTELRNISVMRKSNEYFRKP